MNYERLSHYNYNRSYKLKRTRRLLSLLGEPQQKFASVLVAGTKGKGSTVTMLGSILSSAGLRTGVYTSPHLVSVRERIKIGREDISRRDFSDGLSLIKGTITRHSLKGLTFFEILTALAFLYFAKKGIDIAVLEVGLGGRLDATNTVTPMASVITPISYDHMHLLGATLSRIAGEKCGIIKNGSFVISAPQPKEAGRVIRKVCREKGASLTFAGDNIRPSNIKLSLYGTAFDVKTKDSYYKRLHIPLAGRHQVINSLTALEAAELLRKRFGLDIKQAHIRNGLRRAVFSGRFQVVSKNPYIIIDGAQNKASAESLKQALKDIFGKRGILLILGISADKDIDGIGRVLCPFAEKVIFTRADSPRAASAASLASRLAKFCKESYATYDVSDALSLAERLTGRRGVIMIAGSLYLAGDALKILK